MTDLLDLMMEPPRREAVDPDGPVVIDPDVVLECRPTGWRLAYPLAEIQLHRHDTGEWMWATGYHIRNGGGGGYQVGPKWGKFAPTRQSALHWAARELRDRISRYNGHDDTDAINAWLGKVK